MEEVPKRRSRSFLIDFWEPLFLFEENLCGYLIADTDALFVKALIVGCGGLLHRLW